MSDEERARRGRRGPSDSSQNSERRPGGVPGDVLLVLRIVHAGLMVSILMFSGLLAFIAQAPGEPVAGAPVRAEPPAAMIPAMAAAAAVSLLAIALVRRKMAVARERDPAAGSPSRMYTGSIVSWALAESIALYGFVLGIIHRDLTPYLPFAAVSLIVMLLLVPRRSQFS